MILSSGDLRRRITIQRPSVTMDSYGQPVTTWTDVATVWAAIEPATGRELLAAQAMNLEQPTTITIRWQSVFSSPKAMAAMRAVYNGRIYNIHSAENPDERNVLVKLTATEGMNDG